VAEAANITRVVATVRYLGSAEFEKLSGGSLRLSSPKMVEASRRQSSIRRMNDHVMAVCAKRPFISKRHPVTDKE
jgi:hypothetical protein